MNIAALEVEIVTKKSLDHKRGQAFLPACLQQMPALESNI
jgi:hypothetical protein